MLLHQGQEQEQQNGKGQPEEQVDRFPQDLFAIPCGQ